jgi:hypothetical protein
VKMMPKKGFSALTATPFPPMSRTAQACRTASHSVAFPFLLISS